MGFLRYRNGRFLGGTLVVLAATLALAILAAGCAGGGESSAQPSNENGDASERKGENAGGATVTEDGEAQAGEAAAGEDGAVAGNVRVDPDGTVVAGDVTVGPDGEVSGEGVEGDGGEESGGASASEATLEMKGDDGTAFSGTCKFGDEEMDVSGEVPASFDLRLDGRKLDCEIRKRGEGNLTMVLEAGGSRSVTQITSPNSTVKLTFSGDGGVSVSTSSRSSSGSDVQQNSSSSVVQQGSSSVVQQNIQQQSSR